MKVRPCKKFRERSISVPKEVHDDKTISKDAKMMFGFLEMLRRDKFIDIKEFAPTKSSGRESAEMYIRELIKGGYLEEAH